MSGGTCLLKFKICLEFAGIQSEKSIIANQYLLLYLHYNTLDYYLQMLMHTTLLIYLVLITIILFLVMIAQKLKIAYPIVLVLGGLVIGFIPIFPNIHIDPDIIFVVFLPPLLYEAAWQVSWKEFWRFRRVISVFAFLIVLITSCLIAYVSKSLIPGFTLAMGFLLGGIVSPPDAVAATSVFKYITVPKSMTSIIEGESLLNDASSLIVFRFALQSVNGDTYTLGHVAVSFFVVIVMGILTGLAIAMLFYAIHRWLPTTANIDILFTLVTPYFMYIIAEHFNFSGVLAVVSGGLFLSNKSDVILNYRSRFQGESVWSTLGFALNGLVFMLIGLQLPLIVKGLEGVSLTQAIIYGLIISAVLIVARLICTLSGSAFTTFISRYVTTADSNPGWRGPIIFGWSGMRGVVSLAAALSIPIFLKNTKIPFPERDLIIFITFIVILVTLVLQGLTLPAVVKWMKLKDKYQTMSYGKQDILIGRKLAKTALQFLKERYANEAQNNPLVKNLQQRYQTDVEMLDVPDDVQSLSEIKGGSYKKYLDISTAIFEQQRVVLQQVNKKEEVDEDIIRKYQSIIDIEEEKLRLRSGEEDE